LEDHPIKPLSISGLKKNPGTPRLMARKLIPPLLTFRLGMAFSILLSYGNGYRGLYIVAERLSIFAFFR
jgi:hypothetical protein